MKIGILYESKGETAKKCAKKLVKKLKVDPIVIVDAINLKTQGPNVDIDKYDIVILGSGIRMGKIYKNITKFIEKNRAKLLNKKVAYYICCGFYQNTDRYFKDNIPHTLLENSICYDSFGGELNTEDTKGFNKFIISSLKNKMKEDHVKVEINDKKMNEFVNKIKKELE